MKYKSDKTGSAVILYGVAAFHLLLWFPAETPLGVLANLLPVACFALLGTRMLMLEFWIEGDTLVSRSMRNYFHLRRIPLGDIDHFYLPVKRFQTPLRARLKDGREVKLEGVLGKAPKPGEPLNYAALTVDELNAMLHRHPHPGSPTLTSTQGPWPTPSPSPTQGPWPAHGPLPTQGPWSAQGPAQGPWPGQAAGRPGRYRSWDPEVAGRRPQWSPAIDPYAAPHDPYQQHPYDTHDPYPPQDPPHGWHTP